MAVVDRLGRPLRDDPFRGNCRVVAVANLTLSGLQTIDDVVLVAGDRVLVTAQTTTAANGIYIASSTTWARSRDLSVADDFNGPIYVAVEEGTSYRNTTWRFLPTGAIVVGATAITFSQGAVGVASVTNAMLADMAQATFKMRADGDGTGVPIDGTATQARTALSITNVDNTSDANKPVSTATQTALDLKAPLASPVFTGMPAAPTAALGTDTTQLATTAFVQDAVNDLGLLANATVADYRSNTANKVLLTDIVHSAAAEVTLTDAATIAVDMATFMNAVVTLAGNRTLGDPTNTISGRTGCIRIVQDGTGSRTLAYGSNWKFSGGAPVLTTTAGATDLLFFRVISSTFIFASLVKGVA